MDFAKIMETFDRQKVSFVSVTQHFNTTHSMGRLTLNILLSFAQFEREIIGERIRDKIAASRAKGKWTGGTPILGYDVDRSGPSPKLVVNPTEALRVREMFDLYLELGSLISTAQELQRRDCRTKVWTTRSGDAQGGEPFDKCRLHNLLTNVLYVGKIRHKKDVFPGEHDAIVPEGQFLRVQALLLKNRNSGNPELRNRHGALLRRLLYCKTCQKAMVHTFASRGAIREHVIHVLYGSGANGKSTFIETIATMLGDYATAAAPRLLIRRQGESHPTELVDLREARFVSAIETAEGGAFDEERVKALTGDDRIKARKMRQDFFEFRPTFKLFLATNHRPIVRGDDTGIWRRIRLWPFTVEIPPEEQDHALKEKLRAELPGILAWSVRGCMAWQDDGLSEPPEVSSATQSYREEQDHFGDWFESCCLVPGENEVAETFHCRGGLLYQSYSVFCRSTGTKPLGMWKFSERLLKRPGVIRDRSRSSKYTGVKLTDEAFAAAQQQEGPRWRG